MEEEGTVREGTKETSTVKVVDSGTAEQGIANTHIEEYFQAHNVLVSWKNLIAGNSFMTFDIVQRFPNYWL